MALISKLPDLIADGIKPGGLVNRHSFTPRDVCFSILSPIKLSDRYNSSHHQGPKLNGYLPDKLAVLVSGRKLMERFPDRLTAVGEVFWSPDLEDLRRRIFENFLADDSVFGIPIEQPSGLHFNDEVRLSIPNTRTESVTADLWEGLVISERDLARMEQFLQQREATLPDSLPIFSPSLELLSLTS